MDDNKSPTPSMLQPGGRWGKQEMQRQVTDAHAQGFAEGRTAGRQEVLDWLEKRYITPGPDRPDRGSVEAKAMLELAKEASLYLKGLEPKQRKGRKK